MGYCAFSNEMVIISNETAIIAATTLFSRKFSNTIFHFYRLIKAAIKAW